MQRTSLQPLPRPVACVLFDLDGTLIDSRDDLADAVNAALVSEGHATLDPGLIVQFVGSGARNLVERSVLAAGGGSSETDRVLAGFSEHYRANHRRKTTLYPGVMETLQELDLAGLRLAVVSNKPEEFTRSLLEHFGVAPFLRVILGGDSLPQRKPHPEPFLQAARTCGSIPAESVVVGDGEQDMLAAQAAGMFAIGLTSGFRASSVLIEHGADVLIDSLIELPRLLLREL